MSSQRRINASRANGAKSQGPVTPEGKARSAQNSLRHGILAQTIVLKAESQPAFTDLVTSLESIFVPSNAFETQQIDAMAAARWRSMRIWAIETAGLEHETAQIKDPNITPPTRSHLALVKVNGEAHTSDLLGRYEARYERQYARSFHLLLKYRNNKEILSPTAPPPPPPIAAPPPVPAQPIPPPPIVENAQAPVPAPQPNATVPNEPNPISGHWSKRLRKLHRQQAQAA